MGAREFAHKAMERISVMRSLDLQRARECPENQEYYFGRAHRCDDILFWLSEWESQIVAGER